MSDDELLGLIDLVWSHATVEYLSYEERAQILKIWKDSRLKVDVDE